MPKVKEQKVHCHPKKEELVPKNFESTGWWTSSNIPNDGIRVFWDGSTLKGEFGSVLPLSVSLRSSLPQNASLEGQLLPSGKFVIFDAPTQFASTYEERVQYMQEQIGNNSDVKIYNPAKILSNFHLQSMLQTENSVLLRKRGSKYMEHDSLYRVDRESQQKAVVLSTSPSIKCTDVEGKSFYGTNIAKVEPGNVVLLQDIRKQEDGSSLATISKIRNDLTWSSLCQSEYPYFVSTGLSAMGTCRACAKQFKKSDLRIRTVLLHRWHGIIPVQINMCIDSKCINNGLRRYLRWQVEPFIGKIRVPSSVRRENLPQLEDIEWISENKQFG